MRGYARFSYAIADAAFGRRHGGYGGEDGHRFEVTFGTTLELPADTERDEFWHHLGRHPRHPAPRHNSHQETVVLSLTLTDFTGGTGWRSLSPRVGARSHLHNQHGATRDIPQRRLGISRSQSGPGTPCGRPRRAIGPQLVRPRGRAQMSIASLAAVPLRTEDLQWLGVPRPGGTESRAVTARSNSPPVG